LGKREQARKARKGTRGLCVRPEGAGTQRTGKKVKKKSEGPNQAYLEFAKAKPITGGLIVYPGKTREQRGAHEGGGKKSDPLIRRARCKEHRRGGEEQHAQGKGGLSEREKKGWMILLQERDALKRVSGDKSSNGGEREEVVNMRGEKRQGQSLLLTFSAAVDAKMQN